MPRGYGTSLFGSFRDKRCDSRRRNFRRGASSDASIAETHTTTLCLRGRNGSPGIPLFIEAGEHRVVVSGRGGLAYDQLPRVVLCWPRAGGEDFFYRIAYTGGVTNSRPSPRFETARSAVLVGVRKCVPAPEG